MKAAVPTGQYGFDICVVKRHFCGAMGPDLGLLVLNIMLYSHLVENFLANP